MVLDCETAKTIWKYNPDTGEFFWRVKASAGTFRGDRAGFFDGRYWRLRYKKKTYKASRVAWLIMTGSWPEKLIDHINTDKTDDRWDNLRQATNTENIRNQPKRTNNKLGVKGVHRTKTGLYTAQVKIGARHVLSKRFKTLEEAKQAHTEAIMKYHGEFANLEGINTCTL